MKQDLFENFIENNYLRNKYIHGLITSILIMLAVSAINTAITIAKPIAKTEPTTTIIILLLTLLLTFKVIEKLFTIGYGYMLTVGITIIGITTNNLIITKIGITTFILILIFPAAYYLYKLLKGDIKWKL